MMTRGGVYYIGSTVLVYKDKSKTSSSMVSSTIILTVLSF